MKLFVCGLSALAMITAFAVEANAQNVRWDALGTNSLTQDGWTLAQTADGKDFSSGQADTDTNGVWRINDNNSPSALHMKMYKNPGGINPSQGLVMARIKLNSTSDLNGGTFGYSSAAGNHSIVLCIRNGQLNWKIGQGGNMSPEPISNIDTTSGYRVYALRWHAGGTFDVWYSKGSRWTANQSDWTAVASGGPVDTQSALRDQAGTARDGLLLGNFSATGGTWDGAVDYICWSSNSNELDPWSFNLSSLAPPNASECTANTIPSAMGPGQQLNVSVTFTNWGNNTWTRAAGYKLGAVGNSDPFCAFNRVELDPADSIAYGQSKTFNFTMTAPAPLQIYTTDWQMIQEGGAGWFGNTLTRQVTVMQPDNAQYISDTIPATMGIGQQYTVSVTMKNTSQNTWTQAGEYKLGAPGDDPFAPGRIDLGPSDSIGPNQQKTFTFTMTAPGPGVYTTDWQMVHENICWFGDVTSKQVSVAVPPDGLILSDTLQGTHHASGMDGGRLTPTGWLVTGPYDSIWWHLPYTVTKGAAEFTVTGIDATYPTKTEHWHMYDYTWHNSDYQYSPGYTDNPFKHFVRKSGVGDGGKNGSFEVIMRHTGGEIDVDSSVLPWSKTINYNMRIEWESGGRLKIYRNGAAIGVDVALSGTYAPVGHTVRLGCSPRRADEGSEIGALYSYLKVWDLSAGIIPNPPTVHWPVSGGTINKTTIPIHWTADSHTRYRVRVCTANNPDSGIAWDSGDVTSALNYATTGALSNLANYYVFVKIGSTSAWSAWSAAGYWFRIDTSYTPTRHGLVHLNGTSLEDDGGKFLGLGFTYMRSMQRCKYDRNRFLSDLAAMASKGFNYQKMLSMVSWDGLEIMPINGLNNASPQEAIAAWSDYWAQFDYDIDTAYDLYGIRSEVTVFADAQNCMPNSNDRYAHMDTLLAHCNARAQKIIQIEVANEGWQNGFPDESVTKDFTCYLAARTNILVSATAGGTCNLYCPPTCADIATVHFSRDLGSIHGHWGPVIDPWNIYSSCGCVLPAVSSNEPIGSGSSVATEDHAIHLSSAATFAWIANLPMYVYHGRAGTSAIDAGGNAISFEQSAGFSAYQNPIQLLPGDLAGWTRNDGLEAAAPFTVYCGIGDADKQANKYWTDPGMSSATHGCHRNVGAKSGSQFVCYPQGILAGGLYLKARQTVSFTVYNPLTGAVVMGPVTKSPSDPAFKLDQGPEAYIIKSVGASSPPVIAEVTPDPDKTYSGTEYLKQLSLIQGFPLPTWSVLQGPSGAVINANGLFSGWTPTVADLGDHTIVVRADNSVVPSDDESWVVRVVSRMDFDLDNDVDQSDFGVLQACLSDLPAVPACGPADLNSSGYVDGDDFGLFAPCMAGADRPPGC